MDKFCKALSKLHQETGLTETEYCKRLDIPRATYRLWKYGGVPQAIYNLVKIAKFHSTSLDHLILEGNQEFHSSKKLFLAISEFLTQQKQGGNHV